MRVLITGASGLTGAHLARACARAGDAVTGISRTGHLPAGTGEARAVDLTDAAATHRLIADSGPEVVYHLAALSSVGRSWEEPAQTMAANVQSAVNLLEALRASAPRARVVWASTCEVYGSPAQLPITEQAPVNPANPYAVSKAAGDLLAGVYAEAHGLDVVRVRPFSHAGPGQRPIYLLSSLARQAAQARRNGVEHVRIVTGNPETRRDFTDVRDVAEAYRRLAGLTGHSVYNVCSGRSASTARLVELVAELIAPIAVEHIVDPARVRAHEVAELRGSHARLTEATGWRPQRSLRQTLADTIAWWEHELA